MLQLNTQTQLNTRINPNTSYWLYLHPYVHVSLKKNRAILYNTLNSTLLEYNGNGSPKILKLIKRLNSDNNLYTIRLHRDDISQDVYHFINQLKANFIGDLIDASYSETKPLQFKPKLTLRKGIDLFMTTSKKDKIRMLKFDTFKDYLECINLYINEECQHSCTRCKNAYKQFLYCRKNSQKRELNADTIKEVLETTKGSRLLKLNILGGNIFKHSEFFQLTALLNQDKNREKNYYAHYSNIPGNTEYLEALKDEKSVLKIMVDFPLNREAFDKARQLVKQSKINVVWQFIVENNTDIENVEALIAESELDKFSFSPYYNGQNIDFFKENVFVDKNSITSSALTMKDIYFRMFLNRFSYGSIAIFSNKDIYANVNKPKLGKWGEKDLFLIIAREFKYGKSWARVRKNVKPCKSCVFNALCPPITNYESAIGFNNLCNVQRPI